MTQSKRLTAGAALLGAALASPVLAQADTAVLKDLTSVIALQGQPCGSVVEATRNAENDYLATCSDGRTYRVFIDGNDRVTVTPG